MPLWARPAAAAGPPTLRARPGSGKRAALARSAAGSGPGCGDRGGEKLVRGALPRARPNWTLRVRNQPGEECKLGKDPRAPDPTVWLGNWLRHSSKAPLCTRTSKALPVWLRHTSWDLQERGLGPASHGSAFSFQVRAVLPPAAPAGRQ